MVFLWGSPNSFFSGKSFKNFFLESYRVFSLEILYDFLLEILQQFLWKYSRNTLWKSFKVIFVIFRFFYNLEILPEFLIREFLLRFKKFCLGLLLSYLQEFVNSFKVGIIQIFCEFIDKSLDRIPEFRFDKNLSVNLRPYVCINSWSDLRFAKECMFQKESWILYECFMNY